MLRLTDSGATYDVINAKGELAERVRVPANRMIVGFGPGDVAYLSSASSAFTRVERARLR